MSATNKAVVKSWFENFSSGNFAAQRELMTPDHRFHFPLSPELMNLEAHLAAQQGLKAAVPDLQFTIEDQIVEGDKVVSRWVARGTFTIEFHDLPPTGKPIELRGINIMRLVDGKNAEEWDAFDTLSLMQQMGAIPAPGQDG